MLKLLDIGLLKARPWGDEVCQSTKAVSDIAVAHDPSSLLFSVSPYSLYRTTMESRQRLFANKCIVRICFNLLNNTP